jgi:hexulose-6-phosphate isomerase
MVGEGETVLDKFLLLRDLGYDGVELDSPSGLVSDEVLRAKEESGLEIPGVVDSVHWRDTLGDPDAAVRGRGRDGLETALRDAQRYGASTVLLVPAVVNGAIRYDQAYDNCQAEIASMLPLAEELGVQIAFENVWNNFLRSGPGSSSSTSRTTAARSRTSPAPGPASG